MKDIATFSSAKLSMKVCDHLIVIANCCFQVDNFVVTKIATWNETANGPVPKDWTLMKQCYKEVKTPGVGFIDGEHVIVWNNSWVKTSCKCI